MSAFLTRAATGTVGFMLLDGLWLGVLMTPFYKDHLGAIARMSAGSLSPNWSAAAVVYALLGLGIAAFVVTSLAASEQPWVSVHAEPAEDSVSVGVMRVGLDPVMVDGALVGGASLDPESFAAICRATVTTA